MSVSRSSVPKAKLQRVSTAQFGMTLFLVSLAVLFTASLVAYLVTRFSHPAWERIDVGLPWGLMVSTALLVGVSASLEAGVRAIRRNQPDRLRKWLQITSLLAVGFLLGQVFNWYDIQRINPGENARILSLFTFYLLTGLHAAHVVGGFVPLWIVHQRTVAREYSSSRDEGVRFCAQYWHFLLGVWLVLLGTMYLV